MAYRPKIKQKFYSKIKGPIGLKFLTQFLTLIFNLISRAKPAPYVSFWSLRSKLYLKLMFKIIFKIL